MGRTLKSLTCTTVACLPAIRQGSAWGLGAMRQVLPQRAPFDLSQTCIQVVHGRQGRAWRRVSHGWRSQLKAGNQDSSTRRNSRSRYSCTLQARHISH